VTVSSRAGSKTRTALRQFGIRKATDLLTAFPPDRVDPGRTLAPGSPWQKHLADVAAGGLDQAQLRTIVRVLENEQSLAPVWNWQMRGVRKYPQPARDFLSVPEPRPSGLRKGRQAYQHDLREIPHHRIRGRERGMVQSR
jgi:hypothetical protein